jgi:hypothetical protein
MEREAQEDNFFCTYRLCVMPPGLPAPFVVVRLVHSAAGIAKDNRFHMWIDLANLDRFCSDIQRRGFTFIHDNAVHLFGEIATFI